MLVKPPERYGFAETISYSLSIAEEVSQDKIKTFAEVMLSREKKTVKPDYARRKGFTGYE